MFISDNIFHKYQTFLHEALLDEWLGANGNEVECELLVGRPHQGVNAYPQTQHETEPARAGQ